LWARTVKSDPGPDLSGLAFSGDGRSLLAAATPVRIFEVATGKERARIDARADGTGSFAFSRDGRLLALSTDDGKIHLYGTFSGKQLAELDSRQGRIFSLAFRDDGRYLASGGTTGTVLIWKITCRDTLPPVRDAAEAKTLWADLRSVDASRAYHALGRLDAAPSHAIPLIHERFQTTWKEPDPARLKRLIADLDSDTLAIREQTARALLAIGSDAIAPLRKALENNPSPEQKRRIKTLLKRLPEQSSEHVRSLRALEVLERIGSPAAKDLLRELARKQLPEEVQDDIRNSLQRLESKP
jgi:hypothetical protein